MYKFTIDDELNILGYFYNDMELNSHSKYILRYSNGVDILNIICDMDKVVGAFPPIFEDDCVKYKIGDKIFQKIEQLKIYIRNNKFNKLFDEN